MASSHLHSASQAHLLFCTPIGLVGVHTNVYLSTVQRTVKALAMKRRAFVQSSLLAAAAATLPNFHTLYAAVRAGRASDVQAVTGDGREITLRGADIDDLAARMRGQLLLAGDAGYDDARRLLNPSFDKHPALIAQVTGVADIQAAVNFARASNLLVAVKCGGHSLSGQSSCDRGMQISAAHGSRAARCSARSITKPWPSGS
jgi:hypothetical protein